MNMGIALGGSKAFKLPVMAVVLASMIIFIGGRMSNSAQKNTKLYKTW